MMFSAMCRRFPVAAVLACSALVALSTSSCTRENAVQLPARVTVTVLPDPNAPEAPAAARPVPTTAPAPTTTLVGSIVYPVEPGDTFNGIAAKFGITPAYLWQLNPLRDPAVLNVGQGITVPGPSSTVAPENTVPAAPGTAAPGTAAPGTAAPGTAAGTDVTGSTASATTTTA